MMTDFDDIRGEIQYGLEQLEQHVQLSVPTWEEIVQYAGQAASDRELFVSHLEQIRQAVGSTLLPHFMDEVDAASTASTVFEHTVGRGSDAGLGLVVGGAALLSCVKAESSVAVNLAEAVESAQYLSKYDKNSARNVTHIAQSGLAYATNKTIIHGNVRTQAEEFINRL